MEANHTVFSGSMRAEPSSGRRLVLHTVVGALLPIVLTLVLGFLAAWHHDFTTDQASVLNRMVMLYALPLSLFAGMVTTKRSELTSDAVLAAAIAGAMVMGYAITYLVSRYLMRHDAAFAALAALCVGGPAVPFVGVSVLGYLFGSSSAVPIAVAALVMNIVQVPVTIILLSVAGTAALHDGQPPQTTGLRPHIVHALKEPVVWAPIAGLVFVLAGVPFPAVLDDSFKLLGSATGGVALFASGVILFAQKVSLSRPVIAIVLSRNVLVPCLLWAVLAAARAAHEVVRESVVTLAIPIASISVILAVQYKRAERVVASSLFISTVLSIVTLGAFIALT